MSRFAFAFRRAFRDPGFPLLLLLCALAVFLAASSGAAGTQPPAGVCDLDGSVESRRIVDSLTENGYLVFDSPEDMARLVEQGELDCCLVLPEGLSQRIRAGELDAALPFLSSPSSFAPGLYRSHAAAALFREYAPYITGAAFAGTAVTEEEVVDAYFAMFDEGYAFAFELVTADGAAIPADARSQALVMGAAAILLFAVLTASAAGLFSDGFQGILRRLGAGRAVRAVLLPSLAVRTLCAAAAVSLGLLAAFFAGRGSYCLLLIPPVLIYTVLLSGVGLLLSALLPGKRTLYVLIPVVLLSSLALCPIYTDVTLLLPALGTVRCILPTYWLWLIADRPLAWLPAAAAAVLFSRAATLLRLRLTGKLRLR